MLRLLTLFLVAFSEVFEVLFLRVSFWNWADRGRGTLAETRFAALRFSLFVSEKRFFLVRADSGSKSDMLGCFLEEESSTLVKPKHSLES